MGVERLFGDYTIGGFRELIREEYKRETGLEPISKDTQSGDKK